MGQASKSSSPVIPLRPSVFFGEGGSITDQELVGRFGPLRQGMLELGLNVVEEELEREGTTGLGQPKHARSPNPSPGR